MVEPPAAHLEQRGRHAHERAGEPARAARPLTGRLSTVTSWSWLVKPSRVSVACSASVVAIVHNVPSSIGLMQEIRLTPTSYIVLGLLELAGESTPYELKQLVAGSVGYFWTLQHAQLYTEPERLAEAGLPDRGARGGGPPPQALLDHRRRAARRSTTGAPRPPTDLAELREPALLKLFFGADAGALAAVADPREPGAARRVRGDPRRDAATTSPRARGRRSRWAFASSARRSRSGRSSRTRVRAPWQPPPSRAPPSCR